MPGPDWLDRIRSDNTSGASALSLRAARELMAWIETSRPSPDALAGITRELAEAQPAMAPILNLARRVRIAGPNRAAEVCREFIRRVEAAGPKIAALAAGLIPDGSAVLTHSYSSAVFSALRKARQDGKRFQVVCTESRPVCEGGELARSLAAEGIAVTLIVDAAVSLFMARARLVLVGADAVSRQGVVNKAGTSLIALAAREAAVPLYALCGSEKFLPHAPPPEPPKAPVEIAPEAPNLTVLNYYFDVTGLALFTGVVTEEGILRASELRF